jgi:filamentous hemagglutinin
MQRVESNINLQELTSTAKLLADKQQKKRDLMAKLDQHNQANPSKPIKYNANDILEIQEDENGKIIFLERGSQDPDSENGAGYKHILRHADEFKQCNISIAKLPQLLFSAIKQQKVVGRQGKKPGRPIYELNNKLFAITIGSNGFIVGVNPRSHKSLKKK